jgi:hypothetical protein
MKWLRKILASYWRAVTRDLSRETEEQWLDRQW